MNLPKFKVGEIVLVTANIQSHNFRHDGKYAKIISHYSSATSSDEVVVYFYRLSLHHISDFIIEDFITRIDQSSLSELEILIYDLT